MLSVAAHIGQAKVRKSKPGSSCSRSERIIGASQSEQNARSLVAMGKRGNGTIEHNASLGWAGAQYSTVTDSCRDVAVITQHDVSGHDLLVNVAHYQRFKAATN